MLNYPATGEVKVPDLQAQAARMERAGEAIEELITSNAALLACYTDYKLSYPPKKKAEYAYPAISDGSPGALYLKKLGREFYYLLSGQNLTLTCTDLFPTVSLIVQAGNLTLIPFPEGTRLVSSSGISDSAPVKCLSIASDERLT